MSLHKEIESAMEREVEALRFSYVALPTSLALATQRLFSEGPLSAHIAYASLEHFKTFARRALVKAAYSGVLQNRYPTPRRLGQEPAYKLREHLSDDEIDWNIEMLRKSAYARLEHADAMLAWSEGRDRSLAA
jgi:hypothetical protein